MATGERIKAARKKAGLTQKALGEKCNMPDSQIRQYELGMVNPRIEQLRRIAAALGVYISDLVDDWSKISQKEISDDWGNGNHGSVSHEKAIEMGGYPLNDSEKPLLDNYRQLNNDGKQKASDYVEDLTKIPEYRKEE